MVRWVPVRRELPRTAAARHSSTRGTSSTCSFTRLIIVTCLIQAGLCFHLGQLSETKMRQNVLVLRGLCSSGEGQTPLVCQRGDRAMACLCSQESRCNFDSPTLQN